MQDVQWKTIFNVHQHIRDEQSADTIEVRIASSNGSKKYSQIRRMTTTKNLVSFPPTFPFVRCSEVSGYFWYLYERATWNCIKNIFRCWIVANQSNLPDFFSSQLLWKRHRTNIQINTLLSFIILLLVLISLVEICNFRQSRTTDSRANRSRAIHFYDIWNGIFSKSKCFNWEKVWAKYLPHAKRIGWMWIKTALIWFVFIALLLYMPF